jgi:hypothetical protein
MKKEKVVQESLTRLIREKYPNSTQIELQEELGINQALISRIFNGLYISIQSKSGAFKKLTNVLAPNELKEKPDKFWDSLLPGKELDSLPNKLRLGMTSYAVWATPLLVALRKNHPEWLEVCHTHEANDFNKPIFYNSQNTNILKRSEKENNPGTPDAFSNCYMSGDLFPLLLEKEDRQKLDLIICPDWAVAKETSKVFEYRDLGEPIIPEGEKIRLSNNETIVKMSSLIRANAVLMFTFERIDHKKLTDEQKKSGYALEYIESKETSKEGQIQYFLNEISKKRDSDNKQIDLRHIENSVTVQQFDQGFIQKERLRYSQLNDSQLNDSQKKNKETLNFLYNQENKPLYLTQKNGHDPDKELIDLAQQIVQNDSLCVFVGFSPYTHNIFQHLRAILSENRKRIPKIDNFGIKMTRYNLSEWVEPLTFSLFIREDIFNLRNFRRINELLLAIENIKKEEYKDIEVRTELAQFFYYTKYIPTRESIKEINELGDAIRLYERAIDELRFDLVKPSYSPKTINKILALIDSK